MHPTPVAWATNWVPVIYSFLSTFHTHPHSSIQQQCLRWWRWHHWCQQSIGKHSHLVKAYKMTSGRLQKKWSLNHFKYTFLYWLPSIRYVSESTLVSTIENVQLTLSQSLPSGIVLHMMQSWNTVHSGFSGQFWGKMRYIMLSILGQPV